MKSESRHKILSVKIMAMLILIFTTSLVSLQASAGITRSVTGNTYLEAVNRCIGGDSFQCLLLEDLRYLHENLESMTCQLKLLACGKTPPKIVIPNVGPNCLSCPPPFVSELIKDRENARWLAQYLNYPVGEPNTQQKIAILSNLKRFVDMRINVLSENLQQ